MKLYQLFYLPNRLYTAVFGGLAGVIGATLVDWAPVSAPLEWESILVGVLTTVVFVTAVVTINLIARLRRGHWLADA
ncbi:hypothetical protein [Halohasta salina]|uniref:hypothetical protein n=1 Tax=Halohasta salina TaxID=2961621 RepID=UPI0020A57DEA|nr:hypothetical protein [Halohasta salina]